MNRFMRHGFTLLELSIVLTLIALMLGTGLTVLTASTQSSQFNATVARMDAIDKAILNYVVANNRVPCPSNLSLVVGNTNFGVEAANPGSCTGGTPAATNVAVSGTVEGGLPTRSLRLSDDYAYDAWGRAFRYAVDPVYTVSGALPVGAACSLSPPVSPTAITVYDATGTNARTSMGVYALVSHGANGHGGYTTGGLMMSAGSDNANELINCHCTSAAAAGTYTATYVQQVPTLDGNDPYDNYDDIVSFRDAWQLQAPNYPLTGPAQCYVYAFDTGNSRIQYYTTGMAYAGQFTLSIIGTHPDYVATDYRGYIWASNENNHIEQFQPNGTPTQGPGGSGTALGDLLYPEGLSIDLGGNLWVADNGYNRVQRCAVTVSTFNCTNAAGTGYNNVSGTQTASGNGAGQLNGPTATAIDKYNNLWVVDSGNSRINEYTNAGNFIASITPTTAPVGIAFDPWGNLWVTESGYTIQKFSSSGALITTYTNGGTGNAQFSNIGAIAVDSSGNLWVADMGNNRVQELSNTFVYMGQFGPTSGAQQFNNIGGIALR